MGFSVIVIVTVNLITFFSYFATSATVTVNLNNTVSSWYTPRLRRICQPGSPAAESEEAAGPVEHHVVVARWLSWFPGRHGSTPTVTSFRQLMSNLTQLLILQRRFCHLWLAPISATTASGNQRQTRQFLTLTIFSSKKHFLREDLQNSFCDSHLSVFTVSNNFKN